ncbi:MAG: CoA-binding protein [bacterium]
MDKKHEVCEIVYDQQPDDKIRKILKEAKVIVVFGMSADPNKASYKVGKYLMDAGYEVIPVNPAADEILGRKVYRSLREIPKRIDVVDMFRPPKEAPAIVAEAIASGVKTVWMQEGIVNNEAAKKAESVGLNVIMDRCMKKEHIAMQAS